MAKRCGQLTEGPAQLAGSGRDWQQTVVLVVGGSYNGIGHGLHRLKVDVVDLDWPTTARTRIQGGVMDEPTVPALVFRCRHDE
jgi:hypothetical protein